MRDDQDQKAVIGKVEEQFAKREFVEDGEILQVVGLRLWLADIDVLKITKQEVLGEAKQYVDDLREAGKLQEIHPHQFDLRGLDMGWEGLGFREQDTCEFREFRSYLKETQAAVFESNLPEKAKKLLSEMESSAESFLRRIASVPGSDNTYFSVPILSKMDADDFVQSLLKLPPDQRRTAFIALQLRYEGGVREPLRAEIPWLREVIEKLRSASASMPAIAANHLRGVLSELFDPIVRTVPSETDTP